MGVAAERPLEDPPVRGPVEDGAPQLELADAIGRLHRVELGHPRVVQELAADHRVAEVDLPGVARRRRGPCAAATPPSAMTVWALPSSDLQTSPTFAPAAFGLDRRPQPGPAGADDEDVVRADLRLDRRGEDHRFPG